MKLRRDPNCTLCPLHKTAEYVCLLGQGPIPSKIMIVGEAPGQREDDSGKAFVGKAGRELEMLLEEIGIYREDVFISNAVHCRPEKNRTPRTREINACKKWLDYEISMVKPKYVLLLGNVPLQSVFGIKGIRKHRGKPIERDGIIYLPTYHPASILYDDRMRSPIEQDFKRFREIVEFGGIPYEKEVDVVLVDNWEKVDQMLDALRGIVSSDIETTCLYPWAKEAKINTLGFGTEVGEFVLPVEHRESKWTRKELEHIFDLIDDRLEHCIVVFHAGKFDLLWLRVHFGLTWRSDFDTMLAHYLLDENSLHDLEFLAQLLFGAHKWDIDLKDKQNGPLKKLAHYHGHDLYYTRKAYFKLLSMLKADPEVKRVFDHIMMPCSNLFVSIEHRGCYIDLTKMRDAEKFLRSEMVACQQRLSKWGDINWGSPQQVGQLLYGKLKIKCPMKTPKGGQSTAESALKQIEHPAVIDLLKFRGAKQQLSFFIEGWKPFIVHNRIHPSFKLHGTSTGRLSCEHPNFQQVPRDTRIRSLITTPLGYVLVEIDLSQIEMRIAAEISGDRELKYCFHHDIDVHWRTMINSISSNVGGYTDDIIKTVEMYCVRCGLPPNRTSTEILQDLWNLFKTGEQPDQILQLCCTNWEDQTSGSGKRWSPERQAESVLARWKKNLADVELQKELLSILQEYFSYRAASQRQQSRQLEKIKLADALSLLSRIGPSIATELSPVWKEGRKKAKAVGFGFIFGMWHKKFRIYARDNYDINMSEEEALEHRKSFFNLYKSLEPWHKTQQAYARAYGFVKSLSGRKRRLPEAKSSEDTPQRAEALRQGINAPVQSFANELNLMTLLQLAKEFPPPLAYPVTTVHDSCLIEVREDIVEEFVLRAEAVMRKPDLLKIFEITLTVPMSGEAKIGNWGTGISLKKWLEKHQAARFYHGEFARWK